MQYSAQVCRCCDGPEVIPGNLRMVKGWLDEGLNLFSAQSQVLQTARQTQIR